MTEKDNEMMGSMLRAAARPAAPADIERQIMNKVSVIAEKRIRRKLALSIGLKIVAIIFVLIAAGQLFIPAGTGDALLAAGEKMANHPKIQLSWLSGYTYLVAPLIMLWLVKRAYRNKPAQ